MKLNELLKALPGCRVQGKAEAEITGITFDSRMVKPGFLFAALPGAREDGQDYVDDARQRGAAAVLVRKGVPPAGLGSVVEVDDARKALAALADYYYGSPSRTLDVVGVTGTNGKTTVCYLARQLLEAAGRRTALIGTIEYLIGERSIPAGRTTPEAPHLNAMLREALENGCDSVVMEVSSHALHQHRVDSIGFNIAVFTNLGKDHLDYHGSLASYFGEKESLFGKPGLRTGVVNADDPWGKRIIEGAGVPLLSYGLGEGSLIRAVSVEAGDGGSRFEMETPSGRAWVSLPLLGAHNIYNALAAAGVALSMDVAVELVASTLSRAHGVPGRLEEVKNGLGFRVFVDYAHTEEALESVLRALRAGCRGKLIFVFGCGGDRDGSKRAPMGRAAARLADRTFITSDNPRSEDPGSIIAEISEGFAGREDAYVAVPDRREAIAAALAGAREGDVVLVAGKGHEKTQEFAATVVPFSDRDVIEEELNL